MISTLLQSLRGQHEEGCRVLTRESLAARRAVGVKLGRREGPGKSRLDQYRVEIVALLKNGSPKSFVAKRYKVSEPTLYNWLDKNSIDATRRVERELA
jgi:DNA invertase Pin-like site-specific DNA recombinase